MSPPMCHFFGMFSRLWLCHAIHFMLSDLDTLNVVLEWHITIWTYKTRMGQSLMQSVQHWRCQQPDPNWKKKSLQMLQHVSGWSGLTNSLGPLIWLSMIYPWTIYNICILHRPIYNIHRPKLMQPKAIWNIVHLGIIRSWLGLAPMWALTTIFTIPSQKRIMPTLRILAMLIQPKKNSNIKKLLAA